MTPRAIDKRARPGNERPAADHPLEDPPPEPAEQDVTDPAAQASTHLPSQ
jgi:hypothetical protein